ncbi:MAG: HAMP domain-containing histidine kinase [Acidobacteria bacterium]|nr:HAMP domain-containing histidine kinase [Acidobacteriota bacterium]
MRALTQTQVSWILAVTICVSVAILGWFGHAAVRGWYGSSLELADRRTEEAAMLLVSALTKDMQGAHRSLLLSAETANAMLGPPIDALYPVASAFARYPYAEWFFATDDITKPLALFARRDRPASWLALPEGQNRFPVVVISNPPISASLTEHVIADVRERRMFSVFETTFAGRPYQVIARLLYRTTRDTDTVAVYGFGVDMTWARDHYFPELAQQIARLKPATNGVTLSIEDDAGRQVAATGETGSGDNDVRRPFPATFFDSILLTPNAPMDVPRQDWTVRATASNDPTLAEATRGVTRMLWLGATAAIALLLGVGLTVRAGLGNIRLAELRADFVSSVTHELKTPIATIRAAADTLVTGRITDQDTQREYADMVVQESKRLGQLIDNLLTFSRVTDAQAFRVMDPVRLDSLVSTSLRRFDPQLRRGGFAVTVELPDTLPPVLGDVTALQLMFDNVLDNAIRYTRDVRSVRISGRVASGAVVLEVTDRGIGIHPGDLPLVTQKFFRARNAGQGGTGLGLAIAARILSDHGGSIAVRSTLGEGTTIVMTLPLASARARVAMV